MENKIVKVTENDLVPATSKKTSVVVRDEGSTHIMKEEYEELKIKAAYAGYTVNDFAGSAFDRPVNMIKSKVKEFYNAGVFESGYAAEIKDSANIARLGPLVTPLATVFEGMETTIVSERSYHEQVRLLTGYSRLLELEEQIYVIDSRIHFVKRL